MMAEGDKQVSGVGWWWMDGSWNGRWMDAWWSGGCVDSWMNGKMIG